MAKKSKIEKTQAPSGLTIVRSNDTFTLSWKIGDSDYADGQYFSYLIDDVGGGSWTSAASIGVKTTSKAITLKPSWYYPYTNNYLYSVSMRVEGNRKKYKKKGKTHNPGMSDWSSKTFALAVPDVPSLTATPDENLTNVCTFTWSVATAADDAKMFADVEWQSILVKNSKETDGSKLNWSGAQSGSAAASYSRTFTEDTAILYKNGDSYTRWVRVRSRGARGASAWRYAYRVYAIPYQANVISTYTTETEAGGFQCTINWQAENNRQYPIDQTTVQYCITTPDSGLACPTGASWTDADISRDTEETDSAVFGIDNQLSVDQCLFVRVNTHYSNKITYGKPQLAKAGYLKTPSGLSIETDESTHRATITATNESSVVDSVLVVRYISAKGDSIDIGVIPHGSTRTLVQCPSWAGQGSPAFAVYAMVGSYTKQTREDNVDVYTIDAKMRSQGEQTQGGEVPLAPQNVDVSRVDNLSGTIRVTWDWSWESATSAEISWADHADAWESTDEPETYLISKMHASKWNISGLETGKIWYVRVRLLIEGEQTATYGPWSDIDQGMIDLSSAPNKPLLMLSNAVIPQDGQVTASWVYTTTDNTSQAYAEVALVQMQDTEVQTAEEADAIIHDDITDTDTYIRKVRTYDPIVAHALTAQHVAIDAVQAEWTQGQTYNLACRVKSESGKLSEWSNVVSVTIAEPLVCEITQSSLIDEEIVINPRTFGPADIVSFDLEAEEVCKSLAVSLSPIQDLNGYDKPWVGGAGKNLLPMDITAIKSANTEGTWNGNNYTRNGVTFAVSVNQDNQVTSVIANGTASGGDGNLRLHTGSLTLNGNYILSGGVNGNAWVYIAGTGSDYGNGVSFSTTGITSTIGCAIKNNTTANNIIFKPMIRLATETDATFVPYSNICPISGHDSVDVIVSPTTSASDGTTYTTALGRTVYGGTLDVVSGELVVTDGYIASYNGETLPSTWISDRDVYASGTTPTAGAQVAYKLATPQNYQLTPQQIDLILGTNHLWSDGEVTLEIAEAVNRTRSLKEMPMTVKVVGAGIGGITTVAIERAADYKLNRPDEDESIGYEGETIALFSQIGENQISFGNNDLIGALDDGAQYRLIATIQDGLGQSASVEQNFEVHWEHQALVPSAEITVDEEDLTVHIKPIAPEGALDTDVADIYRLSIDKPELIVRGAKFGTTYVDPYPALGDMGGHRIVLRTANDDYITEDNTFAMIDSQELDGVTQIENSEEWNIIDFEGRQIKFYYNTDYSNTWAKDFQETQYLGGAIQGDWNPAVSRSGTLSTQAITVLDQDMLQVVRRLAEHPGICHVRTADGSSYAADVQVSEDRVHDDQEMLVNYSLSITRVDSEGFEGMTLEQWQAETEETQEAS